MKRCKCFAFITALLCAGFISAAQQKDSTHLKDSAKQGDTTGIQQFINRLRVVGAAEAKSSIIKYKEDRVETRQEELLEKIKSTTLAATNYIKIGPDTNGLNAEHARILEWYKIASDGIFINTGATQISRNLEVSKKILKELLAKTSDRKAAVDKYYKTLRVFRNTIDSLNSDTTLYSISSDSAAAIRYFKKLMVLFAEIGPADSAFKQALINVAALQTRIDTTAIKLSSGIDQIELFQKTLWDKKFEKEFPYLASSAMHTRPFGEVIKYSKAKESLVLSFYIGNNAWRLLLLILITLVSWYFLYSLKEQLKEKNLLKEDYSAQLVLRYPFLSAILIVLSLLQFIFTDPAFIFNAIIWTISAVCLTVIFKGYISRYWMYSWLTLFCLFLLACVDNFMLQASQAERWFMFMLSLAGTAACFIILLKGHRIELREKWIIFFIALVGVMELTSAIANFCGRYNFSKNMLAGGFFNVVIGIVLLWVVRLINQGLSLASLVYETPDRKLFYINFKKLGNRVPRIFYVLLILGWIILLGRNFYSFRRIADPVNAFLSQDRTIGNYTFTIYNLLIFFLIIIIATIVSRIVSFFVADDTASTPTKKGGIGSWLLLVRIAIISIGLFLAFAAAGIPMDRITIIISALGVGIGFGLQTLVNNLVSGLIISFEKPVNVGDIVEIGSHSGVMKSIGFRSSVLYTWDGADLVIPNGDMLNQHLVNWTMSNTSRRIEIPVGVAYGTDLKLAKEILAGLATQDHRILTSPPPAVLLQQFNNSSVDMKLLCWVRNVREWLSVKSDLLAAIDIAFKQNNITIPFPQQDVHIFTANNKTENKNNDEGNV